MDDTTGDPDRTDDATRQEVGERTDGSERTRRNLLSLGGIATATALSGGWLLRGVGPDPAPGDEEVPPDALRFDTAGEGTPVVLTFDTLLGIDADDVPWVAKREGLGEDDHLEMLQFSLYRAADDPEGDGDPAGRVFFPRRISIAVVDRRGDYAVVEGLLGEATFLTTKGLQKGEIVEVELPTAGTGPPVRRPREEGSLGVDVSDHLHLEDILYELVKRFEGTVRGLAGPGILGD